MYESARATWNGFAKNATEGMATPRALPVWTVLLGGGVLAPLAALWFAPSSGLAAAVLAQWVARGLQARACREPARAVAAVSARRCARAWRTMERADRPLARPPGRVARPELPADFRIGDMSNEIEAAEVVWRRLFDRFDTRGGLTLEQRGAALTRAPRGPQRAQRPLRQGDQRRFRLPLAPRDPADGSCRRIAGHRLHPAPPCALGASRAGCRSRLLSGRRAPMASRARAASPA